MLRWTQVRGVDKDEWSSHSENRVGDGGQATRLSNDIARRSQLSVLSCWVFPSSHRLPRREPASAGRGGADRAVDERAPTPAATKVCRQTASITTRTVWTARDESTPFLARGRVQGYNTADPRISLFLYLPISPHL